MKNIKRFINKKKLLAALLLVSATAAVNFFAPSIFESYAALDPGHPWSEIEGFPADCGAGQYVSAIDTGTCSTPPALSADGSNCAAGNYAKGVDASGNAQGCSVVGWSEVGSKPADCGAGQYVSAIDTGTCSTPPALSADGSNCAAGNYAQGVDASGNAQGCSAPGGGVSGSGTANYISKWTGGTSLGNSIISDWGNYVTVNGELQSIGTHIANDQGANAAIWQAAVYAFGSTYRGVFAWGQTYDFYAGGPGTNYGPFTGAHEVKLSKDFPKDARAGMIVSVTGETQSRTDENGKISISSTLPTVKLSDEAKNKAVFGVLVSESPLPNEHWYKVKPGERFGTINALGEGRALVTNINGDIQAGDYITTSYISGYGQKQDDDLLHSYTLGKATENVDWNKVTETIEFNGQRYKSYLIGVIYTSG